MTMTMTMIYSIGGSMICVDDMNEGGNQTELFLKLIPGPIPLFWAC
jgi:hypothetical protein